MPFEFTKDGVRFTPDDIEYYEDKCGVRHAVKRWTPGFPAFVAVTKCRDCVYRQNEVDDVAGTVFWCGKRGFEIDDLNFYCRDGAIV